MAQANPAATASCPSDRWLVPLTRFCKNRSNARCSAWRSSTWLRNRRSRISSPISSLRPDAAAFDRVARSSIFAMSFLDNPCSGSGGPYPFPRSLSNTRIGVMRRWDRAPAVLAAGSHLALDRTLVPAAQRQMRQQRQREIDQDAHDREEDERRKHARDIEAIARFGDAIGEA